MKALYRITESYLVFPFVVLLAVIFTLWVVI